MTPEEASKLRAEIRKLDDEWTRAQQTTDRKLDRLDATMDRLLAAGCLAILLPRRPGFGRGATVVRWSRLGAMDHIVAPAEATFTP